MYILYLVSSCFVLPFWRNKVYINYIHVFSDTVNFYKKLSVRISIWILAGRKQKLTSHSFTTFDEPVRKSFMKIRVNVGPNMGRRFCIRDWFGTEAFFLLSDTVSQSIYYKQKDQTATYIAVQETQLSPRDRAMRRVN